eukprot:CAMPEP_0197522924 /NCGR_PEP_ID=MMETSP1318-20131121/7967_1 /TAXON_ID=552666 /ORGANISM="Partenskyella glossopodia, Strain RCC365" /LENGTH=119 /DNA_ID=CAMNT_0043075455 /DNA_START=556 /DNA_END=915 /DNA_ORIENTATION=-
MPTTSITHNNTSDDTDDKPDLDKSEDTHPSLRSSSVSVRVPPSKFLDLDDDLDLAAAAACSCNNLELDDLAAAVDDDDDDNDDDDDDNDDDEADEDEDDDRIRMLGSLLRFIFDLKYSM